MKKYWFKRKTYGWGWYPATWQGWIVLLGYILILTSISIIFSKNILLLGCIMAVSTVLIYISYRTGESPRWQWGQDE